MATAQPPHPSTEGLTIPVCCAATHSGSPSARPHHRPRPGRGHPHLDAAAREVAALARGLTALGVEPGDRLLIAMSKRAEHWVTDLAAVHLGALPCSTYDTLSTEQLGALARHSAATVLVLEGEEQLRLWGPVLDDLPRLRAVVVLDQRSLPADDPRCLAYSAVRGALPPDDAAFEALTDTATPTSRWRWCTPRAPPATPRAWCSPTAT
ncbi:AMP-binding protein [Streptomyces sp. M19]